MIEIDTNTNDEARPGHHDTQPDFPDDQNERKSKANVPLSSESSRKSHNRSTTKRLLLPFGVVE
jgi:hypothetical protein